MSQQAGIVRTFPQRPDMHLRTSSAPVLQGMKLVHSRTHSYPTQQDRGYGPSEDMLLKDVYEHAYVRGKLSTSDLFADTLDTKKPNGHIYRTIADDYIQALSNVDWSSYLGFHQFQSQFFHKRAREAHDLIVPLGICDQASYALKLGFVDFEVECDLPPTVKPDPYKVELRAKDQRRVALIYSLGHLVYKQSNGFVTNDHYLPTSFYVFVDIAGPKPMICIISYDMGEDEDGYRLTLPPGEGESAFYELLPPAPWADKAPFTFVPLMSVHEIGNPKRVLLDKSATELAQNIQTNAFVVPDSPFSQANMPQH